MGKTIVLAAGIVMCLGGGVWADEAKPASGQQQAAQTLVGRGGKASVIRNGQVEEINPQTLVVPNQARPGALSNDSVARVRSAPKDAKPAAAKGEAAKQAGAEKAASSTAPKPIKPAAGLARKSDLLRMRQMQQEGGWFYTKDNVPLDAKEVEKRIAEGNIEDMKAVDIHMQPFAPEPIKESPPKTDAK